MPFYDYRCEKGHTFEVMQRMSDDALTDCEVCGAPVQRVLHSPAVHFKGSGFYSTDYGKKRKNGTASDSKETSSESGSSSSSDSGSEKSTDSSKSESKSSGEKATSSSSS